MAFRDGSPWGSASGICGALPDDFDSQPRRPEHYCYIKGGECPSAPVYGAFAGDPCRSDGDNCQHALRRKQEYAELAARSKGDGVSWIYDGHTTRRCVAWTLADQVAYEQSKAAIAKASGR